MEEVEDDFGDLYADVEVQVSSAFHAMSNFNNQQLYTEQHEEENKNEERSSDSQGVLRSESSDSNNLKKVGCNGEELAPLISENEKPALDDSKTLVMVVEANGEKDLVLDNGSESEDDLHIVLNEEDCRKYPVSYDANGGTVGMVEGSGDEDDNLVIVSGADRTSKDKKWVDKLQSLSDGLEQSSSGPSAERGTGVKCSYTPQYSQYKYIRAHAATIPSNTKASGAPGVSFPSALSGRGDWDLNGCNQLVGSSSGLTASSCTAVPVLSKNGRDFSLPWYRTILDVNIESFERKPWRQPGVDITDFFNFGLDEESWKHYCNLLEQLRQQSNMLAQIPVYEGSSRPQVYEANFGHESVDTEFMEIPKGRAIQVEGGIGERRPSMDIRRPRNRDSDVVIQISVRDPTESSPSSSQEEPGFADSSMLETSENGGSGLDDNRAGCTMEVVDQRCRVVDASSAKHNGECHLMRSYQRKRTRNPLFQGLNGQEDEHILDAEGCHCQKSRVYVSVETAGEVEVVKDTKEGANESPDKSGPSILEAESSHDVPIQCSSSLSFLNNHPEAPKAGVDIDMEDTRKPAKRPSLNSITGLRESVTVDHYKAYDSNDSKKERGEFKVDSGNQSPMQTEYNSGSKMRLRSVAELKIHADDDGSSPVSDENRYVADHLKKAHETWRGGRKRDYDLNDGDDVSYYKETEISIGYRSAKFTKKQVRKGYPHFRSEVDPYLRRHSDDREYFHDKRITARDSEVTQREDYLCEKGRTNGRTSDVIHEESTWSAFEHTPFYRDEERYHRQTRISDDEYEFRKGREVDDKFEFRNRREVDDVYEFRKGREVDDVYEFRKGREVGDFVIEHSYREEFYQENYGRDVPYRARDYSQEKYDRHGPYFVKEIERSNRRERYDNSSCFDFEKPLNFGCGDDEWWSPDHESLPPYFDRESHISNGRGYRDTASPGNDWYDSWRSDERSVGHWRRIHSEKPRNRSWFDPDDHQDADRTIYPDDHKFNDRGRHNSQSNWAEDEFSFRHQDRGRQYDEEESLFYERKLRHESIHGKHDSVRGEMFLNENQLKNRNRMVRGESRHSVDRDEEAALRCRDSVDLHLVSWEGKSSGRYSKVGDARWNGRNNNIGNVFDKEHGSFRYSDEPHSRKDVLPHFRKVENNCYRNVGSKVERVRQYHLEQYNDQKNEKFPVSYHKEVSVLEERQLAVKEPEKKDGVPTGTKWVSEKIASNGDWKEKKMSSKNAVNETAVLGGFDNQRILDTLAKMEKRRQRFEESTTSFQKKESTSSKKEPDKNPIPPPDVVVEPAEAKQQRPARKRRWGGS